MQPRSAMVRPVGLVVLSLCLLVSTALSQSPRNRKELARQIDALLETDAFENATWAVHVINLESGNVLYSRNARKSMIPASNTKLYTTAAGLDLLGPDFRYRTTVWADGPIADGVLHGNLIVRGSGDPVIGGRFHDGDRLHTFRAWADTLARLGVTRIEGDLIGDDDLFDDLPLGSGWEVDDIITYYAAETGALTFNENVIDLTVEAGAAGGPGRVTWEPFNTPYVTVENASTTLTAPGRVAESYARAPGANHFVVRTHVPVGGRDKEQLAIVNPTLYFVHTLRETLRASGIAVLGNLRDVDDLSIKPDYEHASLHRLMAFDSPPLGDIVRVLNKESNNLFAEQLLKTLGAQLDSTRVGSATAGLRVAQATFAAAGVDTSRLQLVDGSGLSRHNLVTPEMTVRLLAYIWAHPDSSVTNAYLASLPVAGVDGTLETRFSPDSPAFRKALAKTGYVGNARSLSGYVRSARGTPLAFSLMCNHYTVSTTVVNGTQDDIVSLLASLRE